MSRVTAFVVSLCLGALFIAGPAHAAPQITDKEGDANGINDQQGVGTSTNPTISQVLTALDDADGNGIPTAPASYDPADLRSVNFETTYVSVPVGNGVINTPTGVKITIATKATPKSDGPTMLYRIAGLVGGCDSFLNAYLRGGQSSADDPIDHSLEWRQLTAKPACPDGVVTMKNTQWQVTVGASQMIINIPFSSLSAGQTPFLAPGAALTKISASVRPFISHPSIPNVGKSSVTAPNIDSTVTLASWTIGSDVPPNTCTLGC